MSWFFYFLFLVCCLLYVDIKIDDPGHFYRNFVIKMQNSGMRKVSNVHFLASVIQCSDKPKGMVGNEC